jgi:hypothetical protein
VGRDRVELNFTTAFWIMTGFLGLVTLGLGLLLMVFVVARPWPKVADREGLTLRNGKRFLWSQLTNVQAVTVTGVGGVRMAGRADLIFGTQTVHVVPVSIGPAQELFALIEEVTGRPVVSG